MPWMCVTTIPWAHLIYFLLSLIDFAKLIQGKANTRNLINCEKIPRKNARRSIVTLGKVKKNTSRENRLEELGRVDAERGRTKRGKRNLKSEKKRIVRELKSHGLR